MKQKTRPSCWPIMAAWCVASACATGTREPDPGGVSPAAPTEATLPAPTERGADTGRRGYAAADVAFMQGMIAHHAQALVMTDLIPARTNRRDLRLMAERIEVSQRDEIARMQQWLRSRGEPVPGIEAAHEHPEGAAHQTLMPGMLTADELARLAQASGVAFERLFLQLMIRHHEGALVMVSRLFGSPGAAQDPELYAIASDVDADQRAEIRRMQGMLDALPPPDGAPRG